MPSVLVITRFVPESATATNRPLPYATDRHPFLTTPAARAIQVMPSVLVITWFVPELATATNRPLPYVTDCHPPSGTPLWATQSLPLVLVITRLPLPVSLTATNFSCPAAPPHVMPRHAFAFGAATCDTQVSPATEVRSHRSHLYE